MMNCKEATRLTEMKKEGKLGFGKKLQLAFHLMMCKYCREFERQFKMLEKKLSKKNIHLGVSLDDKSKRTLQKVVDSANFKK